MSGAAPPPYPPRRRSTAVIAVSIALVMLLVVTGVGLTAWAALSLFGQDNGGGPLASPPEASSTAEPSSAAPALTRYYEQKLDWRRCDSNQCTRLKVPLDYAQPDGKSIELAVLRSPATRRGERVGQLVVNPGGPGASGVDYAASGAFTFGDELTRYYDIVGFDPRGVGKSTPIDCAGTEQTDEYNSVDPDPDTPAEVSDFERINREYGEGCVERSGDLARHVATVEAVKDLDILRAALGERQLDYLGASYGTLLGATYAELFPTNVRRMVLDGALDPTLTLQELNLGQARGFETALDAFLRYCIGEGDCVLGDSIDEAKRRIRQLLDELDTEPLPTSSGRSLTEGLGRYGIVQPLYSKALWPLLSISLAQAITSRVGDQLLALADMYAARGPDGYTDNRTAAYSAVMCIDYTDSVPPDEASSLFKEFDDASPTFGRTFAFDLAKCDAWPVESATPLATIDAAGAPPIVVIGTTRDPATPYKWAKALAAQLDSGRLITRDGDGHTGFHQGNQCVDDAVERFLVGGTVPKDNLSC